MWVFVLGTFPKLFVLHLETIQFVRFVSYLTLTRTKILIHAVDVPLSLSNLGHALTNFKKSFTFRNTSWQEFSKKSLHSTFVLNISKSYELLRVCCHFEYKKFVHFWTNTVGHCGREARDDFMKKAASWI